MLKYQPTRRGQLRGGVIHRPPLKWKKDVASILSADIGEPARGAWSSFSGFKL